MPLQIRPNQMYEGPWLDRLFPVKLPDGRVCSVTGFSALPAYYGPLEDGLDAEYNARKREWAVAFAQKRFGDPVHVVEPTIEALPEISTPRRPRMRFPWMLCIAALVSSPLDPRQFQSVVTLVWWQDTFNAQLPLEIERAAVGIDWEREARDLGAM